MIPKSDSSSAASDDSCSEPEKKLVQNLLAQGHKGPSVIQILKDEYGIIMPARTLSQKHLQNLPPPPLSPPIRASILSSHAKGLNLVQIQACLLKEV
ncbi:hypothetical protein MJO28_008823 [Puccinia striiformis f. sp. tritici]|uniref:Uncharacterized protein n=1 Tax=Puccinia striiformis f. sp. tritici TaxID=168172 RepID=A0ACC0EC48_9BASI|nr:hypothetical protein MJO28_008823 [Puccinia striiformis f. sp. tritici]